MKEIENKYVVYENHKGLKPDVHRAYEDHVPKENLSKIKLILAIIFDKGFTWRLSQVVKYGLCHHDCYRGNYSSDVLLFKVCDSYPKIWKKRKPTTKQ